MTLRVQTRTASGTFQCRVNEDRNNLKFHRIRPIKKSDTPLPYKTLTSHTSPRAQRTGHRRPQWLAASNKVGTTLLEEEEPGDRRGEMDFRGPRGPGEKGPAQEPREIRRCLFSGFVSKEGRVGLTPPPGLHAGGPHTALIKILWLTKRHNTVNPMTRLWLQQPTP